MKTEIKELFKDNPDLMEGFENFLPANGPKKVVGEDVEQDGGTV